MTIFWVFRPIFRVFDPFLGFLTSLFQISIPSHFWINSSGQFQINSQVLLSKSSEKNHHPESRLGLGRRSVRFSHPSRNRHTPLFGPQKLLKLHIVCIGNSSCFGNGGACRITHFCLSLSFDLYPYGYIGFRLVIFIQFHIKTIAFI